MIKFQKFIYLFSILIFLSSCKSFEKKEAEIRNILGIKSSEEIIESKNSIEISVSCGEDSDLEKFINEGWSIVKEYSEEKICTWKSVSANKNSDPKCKDCKIMMPDKIGELKIYLLER